MKIILTEKQFKSLILLGEGYTKGYIEIKRLAKKCSSLEEFKRKYNNLYEDIVVKYNMESYLKSLFYDKMSIKEIKQELIDGKYVNRTDIIKKNIKLYNAANLISDKYNLIDGVDDILTQVFPKKHPIKLKDFTVDDVVNFIRKYGYKTRSEFAEDKINNGLSVYTGVNKIIRNKALDIVFPIGDRFKFDVNKATVDDVVEFIRSGGYNKRGEFQNDKINGGSRVYNSVDSNIRNKALDIVFPIGDRFKFDVNKATVDDVVEFIRSGGYKTKSEFREDKKNGGSRVYNGVDSDIRNKALGIVFPKKKLKDATVDDVVDFIKSKGYKTLTDFRTDKINGGLSVYTGVDSDVRNKALAIVFPKKKPKDVTVDNKEKRYYNNPTSTNPNISFKYSVKESVRKILKTMI
jgi:hypothetical protein